ncbi:Substrate-binding region of ABC-type glycine betaine transport system [Mesotoga infera]|uniref:Substrate-binding region of ABC-type glycine betaine transport system n=1 Tax=Mesotoga infera TaxID=1236046 RepID=A0A7Z7PNC9_9BACT|nr:glycine betaine ABC transporter substrate-binding protein [Mesotoga infera]SSC12828.1 Substrate-binding region of ABC-type glycine betaine transport system [Mesotoga infera]
MRKVLLITTIILVIAAISFGQTRLNVGAKNFTEQYIASSMISLLLEDAGFRVTETFGMSSFVARNALITGQIDLYADYTGTAWPTYLGHEVMIKDPIELYEAVKAEDLENGIVWLDMAGFNNTYALAVTREYATEHGLKTLEDLAELTHEKSDLLFGVVYEFLERDDGFWPMSEMYGFNVKRNQVKTMEIGLTYEALAKKQIDVAMVFSTDGKLEKYGLLVLEDTKNFFPFYNLAVTVRKDVLDRNPEIADILRPLSVYLTEPIMIRLNYLVDAEGLEPDEVARNFLKGLGLIK